MSLLPIADCLVIEHRRCQCGIEYISPAPIIHRLLASPVGEPRKLVLRPRKEDEFPMDIKTVHSVNIAMLHCPLCWEHNMGWLNASALVPKRPTAELVEELFDTRAINEEIAIALLKAGYKLPGRNDKPTYKELTDYEKSQLL